MYKYLIADYILSYALTSDDYFSLHEPAHELMTTVKDIRLIFEEILRINSHWFTVQNIPDGDRYLYIRKKEFDSEIISWLKEERSKDLFREEKLADPAATNQPRTKKKVSVAIKLSRVLVAVFNQLTSKHKN